LLWTAQDPFAPESKQFLRSWINPLENQSYSNNPTGRANPILPQGLQNTLEDAGIATSTADFRSTQSIDRTTQQVRNVVAVDVTLPFGQRRRATLTVLVDFKPDRYDSRKINVKFRSCRATILQSPIDFTVPLGVIGPTGWLRTVYIDDTIRITRGHKGSVFVLQRPGTASSGWRHQQ
jgi:hypothetical protein